MEQLNKAEGRAAVLEALSVIKTYAKTDKEELGRMVDVLMEEDEAYMEQSGVLEGQPYDEDEAYARLLGALRRQYPRSDKKLLENLTDDYMEAWEIYLESIGAIEWE